MWAEERREKEAKGDMILVRYADDLVVGFQHRSDAERFLEGFRRRLEQYGLEMHPEKTRRIEFGRFAEANRKQRGGRENRKRSRFWGSLTIVGRTPKATMSYGGGRRPSG